MTTTTTRKPLNITPAREAWIALKAAKDRAARTSASYYTDAERADAAAKVDAAKAAFVAAAAPIRAWIDAAENRARVRCITAGDIMSAIDRVPDAIRKKSLVGCKISRYDPNAHSFPGRYNGIPESTHVDLIYRASGWAIIGIYRARCTSDRGTLTLTDPAKTDIIAAAERL